MSDDESREARFDAAVKRGLSVERREAKYALGDLLADALNAAWGDFVSDTGCYPECLRAYKVRGKGIVIEADFRLSNFALFAADWLLTSAPAITLAVLPSRPSTPSASPTPAHTEERSPAREESARRERRTRPWSEYPLGTIAHSTTGGWWTKTKAGWKANRGDTFPTPGADAFDVTLPSVVSSEPSSEEI